MASIADLIKGLKKLDDQSFRPGDSLIASTVNHPLDALSQLGKWLTKSVNTAAGIPDQYDNPYPLLAPSPDAQSQAAFDVAGMAQLGGMPFAPKSAGGTVGTFIGPKAATWDANKAAAASKLLDEGVDPAQVWREHLIGRMPDGNLFSEIDDSVAKITPLENPYLDKRINADVSIGDSMMDKNPMSLDDILSHSELSKAYFQTREQSPEIWFDSLRNNRRGNFSTDIYGGDMVTLSNKLALDVDQEKSTLLHELQHAIQNREGWAKGGSAEGGWISDRENVMNIYKSLLDEANKPMSIEDYARIAWGESPESKAVIDDYNNSYLPSLKTNVNKIDKSFQEQAGREYYRRLTGEAQARATQDRLNMSMDERRNNYPLAGGKLSDIPLEQLIYRYGDNGPAMAVDAWHGSPHKFDKFDMSKIGTGEGAQAYGHGLYFAEQPETAKTYATIKQQEWRDAIPLKQYHADSARARGDFEREAQLRQEVEDLKANMPGNLYKTSLEWPDPAREAADPLGPHHFLDFDAQKGYVPEKPMSALNERLKAIENERNKIANAQIIQQGETPEWSGNSDDISDIFGGLINSKIREYTPSEREVLSNLANESSQLSLIKSFLTDSRKENVFRGDQAGKNILDLQRQLGADNFSKRMSELGIPGIRYLDGGSRGAGEGSYNYVVFDDQIPKIVERNGQPVSPLVQALSNPQNLNESLLQKYLQQGSLTPDELAQYERNAVAMRDSNRQYLNVANADAQGGTAMDRAGAMGFDMPTFHGTNADIASFDPDMSREHVQYMKGIFTADNPELSANYGDTIYPLLQNNGVTLLDKRAARKAGAEIPTIDSIYDKEKGVHVTTNPSNIRSRFAAFDPLRKDSADLLASKLLPATMLGWGMYNEKKKRSLADLLGAQ